MSEQIPESLVHLEANGGIFAIWKLFQHYGIDLVIEDLVQLCGHNREEGTYGIALAVGLKKLGLDIRFHTEHDPDPQATELMFYREASKLNIPVDGVLSYDGICEAVNLGRFVIVYYDTLEGVGNHSLVYDVDEGEISFFDSFEAMPRHIFEQQRQQEGICQQVIVIDDRQFVMRDAE
jgi:hypothetical protein